MTDAWWRGGGQVHGRSLGEGQPLVMLARVFTGSQHYPLCMTPGWTRCSVAAGGAPAAAVARLVMALIQPQRGVVEV
jgi:hypothetical protein